MSRSVIRLVGAGLLAAAVLFALGFHFLREMDGSLERVRTAGVLRVGFAVEAPFAFVAPDSQVRGAMPDAARDLARALGVPRVEFVQTSFQSLMPDLLEHRFDVIAAGFYITAERRRSIRFSSPVLHSGPSLVVRKGNPLHLPAFFDLKPAPQLRLAIMDRTGSERLMIDAGYAHDMLLLVPDPPAGASAVISGAAQGLLMPIAATRLLAAEHPADLEVVEGVIQSKDWRWGELAFAFHPDDAELLAAWEAALAPYLAGPEFRDRVRPYGFSERDFITQ